MRATRGSWHPPAPSAAPGATLAPELAYEGPVEAHSRGRPQGRQWESGRGNWIAAATPCLLGRAFRTCPKRATLLQADGRLWRRWARATPWPRIQGGDALRMELPQLFAVLTAFLTWGAFIGVSKYYFRHARRRNAAKTLLVVSAGVCTLAQLVTVVRAKPPSEWWSWLGSAGFVPAHILYWWALSTHGKSRPAFV